MIARLLSGFRSRRNCSRALLATLAVLLVGCASAPPAPVEIPLRPQREGILGFGMTGRLVIQNGQKADTVRIAWDHTVEQDALVFSTAMGIVAAELRRTAEGAVWTTSAGERFEARNADQLMAQLTEQPVPLKALSYWLVGRLTRDGSGTRDAQGRLLEGTDQGWAVRVLAYEVDRPDALPSIVEVSRGSLRIRLAIEGWVL